MENKVEIKMQLLETYCYAEPTKASIDFCREAYKFITEEEPESASNASENLPAKTDMPDGVYLIREDGGAVLFDPSAKKESTYTAVGLKMGSKSIAIALEDANGGEDTELTAKKGDNKYSGYIDNYQEAVANWNGKQNTEHLKTIGLAEGIELKPGQWIPSLGEFKFIDLFRKQVNEALAFAGGQSISPVWYWTSTEYSATNAWILSLDTGYASLTTKAASQLRVRPVSAFL